MRSIQYKFHTEVSVHTFQEYTICQNFGYVHGKTYRSIGESSPCTLYFPPYGIRIDLNETGSLASLHPEIQLSVVCIIGGIMVVRPQMYHLQTSADSVQVCLNFGLY